MFWLILCLLLEGVHGVCDLRDGGRLDCSVRTLNASLSEEHPSASSLVVHCSDVFLYESLLRTNHFGYRPELMELDILYCKLRLLPSLAFSGLSGLQSLVLRSMNSEWPAMALDIAPDAFTGLDQLEELTLTHNNLWSLPGETFCSLSRLQALNLSHNYLQDAGLLGFSSCSVPLQSLDLSFNSLSDLPPGAFAYLQHLEILLLQHNDLSAVTGLESLESLEILNLSHNRLVTLPPDGLPKSLKTLSLQNNSITTLTPLGELNALQTLNLSRNELSEESVAVFSTLRNLQALDLSHNRFRMLTPGLLKGLESLQVLDLRWNALESIQEGALAQLGSLRALLLSHNDLMSMEGLSCCLRNLQTLSLDYNAIRSVDTLGNLTSLQDLNLKGNRLSSLSEDLFIPLNKLRMLDLSNNDLSSLNFSEPFRNQRELYALSLSQNRLSSLPKDLFTGLEELQILDLGGNAFDALPQKILNPLGALRVLRLDDNALEDINGLLTAQSELTWLNISSNAIQWFDYATIPKSLEWLDVSHNRIEDLENYYKLTEGFSLQMLDLSNNRIKALRITSLVNSLEYIFLGDNQITDIQSDTFSNKVNLRRVELQRNSLRSIPFSVLVVSPPSYSGSPEFFLSQNPYHCDCEIEYLKSINSLSRNPNRPAVLDLDDISCSTVQLSTMEEGPRALLSIPSDQFLCPYTAHCFALCMCCDFFACDCRMHCPKGCACFHDPTWSANVIHCSRRGHVDVPPLIPMDATSIYLDGNNFTGFLESQAFIGRKRVSALYLNASHISALNNQTFNGLAELEVLHLENNLLSRLEGYEFSNLTALKELFLQNNLLSFIHALTFASLPTLETLRLDGNQLLSFPVWNDLPLIQKSLYLAGNPWSCRCEFLQKFKEYISNDFVRDATGVQCSTSPDSPKLSILRDNVTCSDALAVRGRTAGGSRGGGALLRPDVVPIAVSILALCIVLAVSSVMIFVFRTPLRVWLHSKYGVRLSGSGSSRGGGDDKLYDAYVSYSVKDDEFVRQVLSPPLEEDYKLCLQHRDIPGGAEILPGMSQLCTKQVLVVSKSYLETEWIRTKFSAPRDTKAWKPLLVLLEELSSLDLASSPELNILLKTAVVLKWNETGFWNKLRFYLPDKRDQPPQPQPPDWPHYDCTIPSNNSSASTRSTILGGGGSSSPRTLLANSEPRPSVISNPLEGVQPQPWSSSSEKSDSLYSWMDHTYQTIGQGAGGDFPGGGHYNPLGNLDVMLPDGRLVPATLVRHSKDGRVLPLVQVSSGSENDPPGTVTFPRTIVYKAPEADNKGGYLV